jgi:Integrase zinc binding domain
VSDEKLVCRIRKDCVQVVVPEAMVENVLQWVHGSRVVDHWGVSRKALAVARRYWWPNWLADVEADIERCLPCATKRLGRSGKWNGKMVRYTPPRRCELVALDITELSPLGQIGERRVVVIGDVKSRFVLAVPCRDEHAETLSKIRGSGGLQYSTILNIADGPWKTIAKCYNAELVCEGRRC